jgi:hypothetical protein
MVLAPELRGSGDEGLKGVHIKRSFQDLTFLPCPGLVELKETRRGVPVAPTLPYDEIDVNLRIRL